MRWTVARAVASVCMGLWLGAALFFALAAVPVALRILTVGTFGRLVTALLPSYFLAGAGAGAVGLACVLLAPGARQVPAGAAPEAAPGAVAGPAPAGPAGSAADVRWHVRRPALAVLSAVVLAANLYVDLGLLPPMAALENRLLPRPSVGNPLWAVFFRLHGEAMGANFVAMLAAAAAWVLMLAVA